MRVENIKTIVKVTTKDENLVETSSKELVFKFEDRDLKFETDYCFSSIQIDQTFHAAELDKTLDQLRRGYNVAIVSLGTVRRHPRVELLLQCLDHLSSFDDIELQYWYLFSNFSILAVTDQKCMNMFGYQNLTTNDFSESSPIWEQVMQFEETTAQSISKIRDVIEKGCSLPFMIKIKIFQSNLPPVSLSLVNHC